MFAWWAWSPGLDPGWLLPVLLSRSRRSGRRSPLAAQELHPAPAAAVLAVARRFPTSAMLRRPGGAFATTLLVSVVVVGCLVRFRQEAMRAVSTPRAP